MADPEKDSEELTDPNDQKNQDQVEEEHEEVLEAEEDQVEESADTEESADLSLEEQLEKALAEVENFKDAAMRAEAEMQNVRRRARLDVENAHKFGIEKFLQNLIPVVDSIEKAIEASEQAETAEDDPVFEGIKLCHKLLVDVLKRENIEVVDPEGEPFDPNAHEALSAVPNPDVEPNTVIAVVQKGYKLNDRLVRPAMVMVSKAP